MSDPVSQSDRLKSLVEFVGTEVTSSDLDVYSKFQELENKGKKLGAILEAWTAQEDHYRKSRERYSNWIIGALLVQAVCINVAFFFIGFRIIEVDKWVANTFIIGVFGEMTSLTLIVFKYFFPSSPSKMAELVDKL